MKITIDIETKEITTLRTLLQYNETLMDVKIAEAKVEIVDKIATAIKAAKRYRKSSEGNAKED